MTGSYDMFPDELIKQLVGKKMTTGDWRMRESFILREANKILRLFVNKDEWEARLQAAKMWEGHAQYFGIKK